MPQRRGVPPTLDDLMTPADAAELVGIAPYTLRDWARQGRVPLFRVGSRIRYRRSDLERLIAPVTRSGGAA